MELRQFLQMLSRYRSFIALMCLSAVVTAVILTYVVSEKYTAATTVLIRPQKSLVIVQKREEILNFPVSYLTPVETASKTYTEIIKSRNIAEMVVRQLGLDTSIEEEGSGFSYFLRKTKNRAKALLVKTWTFLKHGRLLESDAFSHAVSTVQRNLSVKPTKETYLFEIEAESRAPQTASDIANVAAQAFVGYLQELNEIENEKSKALSREKIKLSREKLQEARQAIVDFKKTNNVVSLKKEMELELEVLSGLGNSREITNTKIIGIKARKEEVERQIAEQERFSKSASKVTDNPLVRELYSELARNEVKLAGLRKRYTGEHRFVQALLAEIKEIKEKLKQEAPTLNSEETSSVDPVYQELISELTRVKTDLETLKAERARLDAAILEKRSLIEEMPKKEAELSRLELAEKLSKETHMLLTQEYEELVVAEARNMPHIAIIHAAVAPLYPTGPIKVYYAGLAGVLSLIAALGMILLMENINVTVRSIDEAEEKLGLPVMMTVPYLDFIDDNAWPLIQSDKKAHRDDKREQQRAYVQYPLEVRNSRTSLTAQGVSSDISPDGMCCYVEKKLNLESGDKVEVFLDMNGGAKERLRMEGVVLRFRNTIAEYHFSTAAIQFTDLNDSVAEQIKKIVQIKRFETSYSLPANFEEPVRGLRSDILFMNSQGMSSFLITSSSPGEGKSTIVANLALSLAELNKKVLIIDANMRSPSLHKILHLPNETGLSSILAEDKQPYLKKTESGINVITSGPAVDDPSALLGSYDMLQLLKNLKSELDIILIDSPPLLTGPDSAVLASIVHGALMVLSAGNTSIEDFGRAKQILERSNAKILGIVMNGFEDEPTSYYNWS